MPEILALIPHTAWGLLVAILLYLVREERKERMLMGKLLLEASKEQIVSTSANTAATSLVAATVEKFGGKLDALIDERSRRGGGR